MNDSIRQQTREYFHDNALACIAEVDSGAVKLASHYPVERYRAERLADAADYLAGRWDHTFTFQQRAKWIETGTMTALFP